jgi:hypothetical protein
MGYLIRIQHVSAQTSAANFTLTVLREGRIQV